MVLLLLKCIAMWFFFSQPGKVKAPSIATVLALSGSEWLASMSAAPRLLHNYGLGPKNPFVKLKFLWVVGTRTQSQKFRAVKQSNRQPGGKLKKQISFLSLGGLFTCVHLDSFDATVIEAMATTRIIKFVKLPAMSVKSEKQYTSYSTVCLWR